METTERKTKQSTSKTKNSFCFYGFTLSEVLITIGIIGVVAVMTIGIIRNTTESGFKVAYKKAYASANNAFKMAIAGGETFSDMTDRTDSANACINWLIFSKQFKKVKECINTNNNSCWGHTGESSNNDPGSDNASYAFIDDSGVAWTMRGKCSSTTENQMAFLVDTNGFKLPNKYGKDRWVFSWMLNNSQYVFSGTPTRITTYLIKDYIDGTTDALACPTGPCYYKTWLYN